MHRATGEDAIFDSSRELAFMEITDGTSNALMVLEAKTGSVQFLAKIIDESTLRALLTSRGSEVIPSF